MRAPEPSSRSGRPRRTHRALLVNCAGNSFGSTACLNRHGRVAEFAEDSDGGSRSSLPSLDLASRFVLRLPREGEGCRRIDLGQFTNELTRSLGFAHRDEFLYRTRQDRNVVAVYVLLELLEALMPASEAISLSYQAFQRSTLLMTVTGLAAATS